MNKSGAFGEEEGLAYDGDLMPYLEFQTCGECNTRMTPQDQEVFLDDDLEPAGLMASSQCPTCGCGVVSVLGAPEFIRDAVNQITRSPYNAKEAH